MSTPLTTTLLIYRDLDVPELDPIIRTPCNAAADHRTPEVDSVHPRVAQAHPFEASTSQVLLTTIGHRETVGLRGS